MYRWTGLIVSLWTVYYLCHCEGAIETVKAKYKQQNVELSCPPDAKGVLWFKGDKNTPVVTKEKEYEIFDQNNTLRILSVEPKLVGNGTFFCIYGAEKEEKGFKIYVESFVKEFDKARNVIQGDPLRLVCNAWGIPEPTITWYHDGNQLVQDGSGKVTLKESEVSTEGFPKLQNGTIRIVDMDDPQKGNYSCLAANRADGKDYEAFAYVRVEVKDKYAALWPFLGICVEVAVLCTIILIYERRRAKRIEEEERQEEAAHLNANNDSRPVGGDEVRQRK